MKNLLFFTALFLFVGCGPKNNTKNDVYDIPAPPEENKVMEVTIHPVFHGSLALTHEDKTVLIDPYNGAERYTRFGAPDLLMITHTHGDHMDMETLKGLDLSKATLLAPQAVADALADLTFAGVQVLRNGETASEHGVKVEAVPAYNLPSAPKMFHPKGDFNGYVLTIGNETYYFSGDTQDVPEIRALKGIDYAFVCMNQPYTMTVEAAADMVAEMQPTVVYPYHYRNGDGTFSDLDQFELLVKESAPEVEVRKMDWYKEAK
ncbi:MBL fold metallo-hydrolase [Neolewinella agarilytica]|uniref:MBL fold metallo-hydrolase n=1 Tax=Neolewinella agarilytica TaxID=478744 RepID=UPI0023521963|nr:MBL fold metallo-hydrolase [Neolewinella agarilytica]